MLSKIGQVGYKFLILTLNFDMVESLHNESFIERKWLQEVITETLQTSGSGVLITADMGYGKSSFVSNLICAESSSTWYDLRKQILAYHSYYFHLMH
jgi:hypothetical protein